MEKAVLRRSHHVSPGDPHRIEAVTDCQIPEASSPEVGDVPRDGDRYRRTHRSEPG